jgi:riboflavin kinase/FMN adenylyltransferase
MKLVRHAAALGVANRPRVLTLGNFDGVHIGHQALLRRVAERARACNGIALALSFHPHPGRVLAPERAPLLLTSLRQRVRYIAERGIDALILLHFTSRLAAVEAQAFVTDFLLGELRATQIVAGERVGFGRGRSGNTALLAEMSRQRRFDLEVVPAVRAGGEVVSSSRIRAAVAAGDLDRAARMLGRRYAVEGRVEHGLHRGRGLGFPTANLRLRGLQLPPNGVYAVRVRIGGEERPAVANLGVNPTFGDRQRTLEAHVLDFDGDLYGAAVAVSFFAFLRSERKFASIDALVEQIRADVDAARRLFS